MKYLGVDWGLNKIGLALSEGEIASPLATLNVQANGLYKAVAKVTVIAREKNIGQVVLGKPEGKMGEIVESVAAGLKKEGLDVILADETLSTKEAKRVMLQLGMKRKSRREDNAMSASIILQRYLDEK